MRTLVTGGAGFIGTHLVERLLEEADEVVVLDSLENQVHETGEWTLGVDAELIVGNVGSRSASDRAVVGVDRVAHMAAVVGVGQSMYEIERCTRMNTLATASFLEAVVAMPERLQRLVVASSMSIYGEGEYECPEHGRIAPGPRPEHQLSARDWECECTICGNKVAPIGTAESKPLIPTSVYAVGKRDHEELCLVVGAAYDISTTALRFFNVYGPGQALSNPYTGVAAIFASRLLNGRPPVIFEDGNQSRDFIHVDDIVDGIVSALESDDTSGRALNLGPVGARRLRTLPLLCPLDSALRSNPSTRHSIALETSGTASPIPRWHTRYSASRRRSVSRMAWPTWCSGSQDRRPWTALTTQRASYPDADSHAEPWLRRWRSSSCRRTRPNG